MLGLSPFGGRGILGDHDSPVLSWVRTLEREKRKKEKKYVGSKVMQRVEEKKKKVKENASSGVTDRVLQVNEDRGLAAREPPVHFRKCVVCL